MVKDKRVTEMEEEYDEVCERLEHLNEEAFDIENRILKERFKKKKMSEYE